MSRPKAALISGVELLNPLLASHGFQFLYRGGGKSSGGTFAWGEFIRGERRLELHFRHNLGMVRYHVGDQSASHESYMRELGVWPHCRYPGFSDDTAAAFQGLAHDLAFAEDFMSGNATVLQSAATKESLTTADENHQLMRIAVGDQRTLQLIQGRFREKRYRDVITLAAELKHPDKMNPSERRMVDLAKRRAIHDSFI